jgi:hypothetical protein
MGIRSRLREGRFWLESLVGVKTSGSGWKCYACVRLNLILLICIEGSICWFSTKSRKLKEEGEGSWQR